MNFFRGKSRNRMAGFALGAVILALTGAMAGMKSRSKESLCTVKRYKSASFTVCEVDLRKYELKTFLMAPDGKPFGSFVRLREAEAGSRLLVAMNAGMFQQNRSPLGLYVEKGQQQNEANLTDGSGNFYLKPNGVFFVLGQSAGILETKSFVEQRPSADYANQSGPMLVIDGKLHPKIAPDGPSRFIRNGVGIKNRHTVILAISNEAVSFGVFAKLFRDKLQCRNALYLDGAISGMYAPSLNRADSVTELGPIVGVFRREKKRSDQDTEDMSSAPAAPTQDAQTKKEPDISESSKSSDDQQ